MLRVIGLNKFATKLKVTHRTGLGIHHVNVTVVCKNGEAPKAIESTPSLVTSWEFEIESYSPNSTRYAQWNVTVAYKDGEAPRAIQGTRLMVTSWELV